MSFDSRFQMVTLLHDVGDSPDGNVGLIYNNLVDSHPGVRILRPYVPMYLATAKDNFKSTSIKILPMLQPDSLIVGVGISGLFASVLQDNFPGLNLTVFTINSPISDGGLIMDEPVSERVSVYSSEIIKNPIIPPYSTQSFDVKWLSDGIEKSINGISYIISSFMRYQIDMKQEIARLVFPVSA